MKVAEKSKDFFKDVFEVVTLIPRGRVTSYGAIAKYLGSPRSSRMVGWAMNASHSHTVTVPAHRVVNRDGLLSGKHNFNSPNEMQERLEQEGIQVYQDKILHFSKVFWDPLVELDID